MRFVCGKCQTRYTVPDEKARGKALKVRCKKCGNVISLKPEAAAPEPDPEPMSQESTQMVDAEQLRRLQESLRAPASEPQSSPARRPAPPPVPTEEWFALVGGQQVGPLSRHELAERFRGGEVKARTYVWRDGLEDWKRLEEVPELATWIEGETDRRESAPEHEPAAPAVVEEPQPVVEEPASAVIPGGAPVPWDAPAAAPWDEPIVVAAPREPAPAQKSPGGLDDLFGSDGEGAEADAASAGGKAELAAKKEADPFGSVPDSPDLVQPSEPGEMTRFIIAQAKVSEHRSPKRIALFAAGGLCVLAGLLFLLSRLGVSLPLVSHRGSQHQTIFSGAESDAKIRDELLGAKRRAERQQRQAVAAIATGPRIKGAEGPTMHKEAQHVDKLDAAARRQLASLYAKRPGEDIKLPTSDEKEAPAVDRADAPLTAEQVAATISHFQSGYAMCIDRELKRNPAFRGGKVRIVTTIMSSGLVRQAEIQSDDAALVRRLAGSSLGGCLVDQTKRMVFPNFSGDPFDAEIPLVIGAASM